MPVAIPEPPPATRRIFCNRTLNLRAIKAIGYDMDYTLVHYHVDVWERRAYEHARDRLVERGWDVSDLTFDADLVERGLIIDTHNGNVVKADRFGYIKAGAHGTEMLPFSTMRELYRSTHVDLRDKRWVFISTLFGISGACLYSQLVDRLDAGTLVDVTSYGSLFAAVKSALDLTHIEGELKAEIIRDPARYIDADPGVIEALLDQRAAGKRLLLVTNSEWSYTLAIMRHVFDPNLPEGQTWRDVFELVIVQARKPSFFADNNPIYEVVDDEGHLLPVVGPLKKGGAYYSGSADHIEAYLGLEGGDILYVGDHIFADVNASKRTVAWRTALVLRELESDIEAIDAFADSERKLGRAMARKSELEARLDQLRLLLTRRRAGRRDGPSQADVQADIEVLKAELEQLDQSLAPLAEASATQGSERWGLVMRAGIDKSHMARQIERFADIYMSRVSNFLYATPSAYMRAPKASLPHDPVAPGSAGPQAQDAGA